MQSIITIESVDVLWDMREQIAQKNKPKMKKFFKLFLEVIENVAQGNKYSLETMQLSPYWNYLQQYHKSWRIDPPSTRAIRQIKNRFQNGIDLFYDIKQNGLRDPLEMFYANGSRYIILGYRRLVILHVLGVETAHVLTHPDYEAYRKWRRT